MIGGCTSIGGCTWIGALDVTVVVVVTVVVTAVAVGVDSEVWAGSMISNPSLLVWTGSAPIEMRMSNLRSKEDNIC